jgi:ATP-dependent RNA helicase DDX49/DBP8
MASDSEYSSSEEVSLEQNGARKRRRLSPSENVTQAPLTITSRIKAKQPAQASNAQNNSGSIAAQDAASSTEKTTFASINVAPWLIASLASMEIKRPTGIQKACIPEIMKGRDCIGGSRVARQFILTWTLVKIKELLITKCRTKR